jgi:Ni/Fe-hydrogenase subunit HybB-like protein
MAFQFNKYALAFWIENALYVYSFIILLQPPNRSRPKPLFLAAAAMVLAGAVYRFNTYLVGFNPGNNWNYFPSFGEGMITLGIISFEIMAYLYIVKTFPVLPKAEHA